MISNHSEVMLEAQDLIEVIKAIWVGRLMISLAIVLAACFLVGVAFTNPIARAHKIHSGFGLVVFLIGTNSVSSMLKWNVGQSASLVVFLSIIILIYRSKKLFFEKTFLREFSIEFIWSAIVALALSPIFLLLSKDIASRNFDAYYATQDGIFLSDHSVLHSTGKVTELLPLTWGADSSDRYGISFFTSLIQFITNENPWLAAKYIYIAIATISIFAFRSLVLSFLPKSQTKLANLLSIIFVISPFFILQSMYFMYGQTIALVFFPLFILLMKDFQSKLNQVWLAVIVVTSFVSYPAISLILGLILFLFLTSNLLEKENRKTNFRNLILIFFTVFTAVVLAFGFNFAVIIDRVWTWIGGHLGLTKAVEDTSNTIRIELFSQFDSILGVPLYLGLIPHPFSRSWNLLVGVAILLVLSWYSIHSIRYFYQYLVPHRFKRSFIIIFFVCLFVPLVSFIKGSGYIVFKTSTWFGPYLLLIFTFVALHKLRNVTALKIQVPKTSGIGPYIYGITSLIFITMVFNTSFQYSKMFSTWNSFSQIPNSNNSSQLSSIRDIGDGKVAIILPTAEESTWLSGMMSPSLQSKTFSLGQNEQALTEGLKTSCSLNKVQRNFSQVTSILHSSKTYDVVPQIRFSRQPARFGDWSLNEVKDLEFAAVVNSGAFPPTLSTNHLLPLKNQVAMRWSGGSMCLGIFSAVDTFQKVRIPVYFLNSEGTKHGNWNIVLNDEKIVFKSQPDYLDLKLYLQKGWNSLLLRNLECPLQVDVNRLRGNADDRPLCVMFGRLVLTE
jgi:hypothetical protein